LKHEVGAWMADWLIDLLMEVEGSRLRAVGADAVTYVPLHWRRRLRRGFNQSSLLAARLAYRLRLPFRSYLRRRESGGVLAGSSRTDRVQRMKNAFAPPFWPRSRQRLDGHTILLVDDVLTTGATCGASARILRSLGAARVVAVTIARAEGA
jgi:predicted amidophosphoribosyltransferase